MTRSISLVLAILFFVPVAFAGPGHDHGPEQAAKAAPAVPRLVAEGSELELVATPKDHTLTIYLDKIATNEPVEGAKIEVMGDGITQVAAKEIGDGTYEIEGEWIHDPGSKALTFVVTAGNSADLLAGVLVIAAGQAEEQSVAALALSWPVLLVGAGLIALGGFCLAFAFRPVRLPAEDPSPSEEHEIRQFPSARMLRNARNSVEILLVAGLLATAWPSKSFAHEGHDHGDEGASAQPAGSAPAKLPTGEVFLPKASQRLLNVRTVPAAVEKAQRGTELVGTVIADPAYEGRVQAPMDGQIELADGELSFVGKTVAAGDVLALLAPAMPVYERGTLQQVTADVEGKLRIAEQKLARLTRISGDYIPQREIEDTKTEIESLREQKRVLEPKNAERLQLKAPVSGIISVATVRAGQVVSARDTLFEIVDPKRIWIEAIGITGTDDNSSVSSANALDAQGHKIPLTYIGRAPALRQQALPMLFKVDDSHSSLGIGATVKVLIQHGTPAEGIIVPTASVVRAGNGLSQVWVKVSPERFAPKPVRTMPLDGDRVVITHGLTAGDRVVVEASELINQVR